MENVQTDLNRFREWAFEDKKLINQTKSKAVYFTKARLMEPLNYSLRDIVIPVMSSCKYLGIILRSDLRWADQVNYTIKKRLEGTSFCNEHS
jgi:hypothetical protein